MPALDGAAAEQTVAAIMDGAGICMTLTGFMSELQYLGGASLRLCIVLFLVRIREQCVQLVRAKREGWALAGSLLGSSIRASCSG